MLRVGVKYCGGCNPEYDRVDLVEQLKKGLEGRAGFVPPGTGDVDIILAVCGCRTACADMSSFQGSKIRAVTSMEEGEKFVRETIESGVYEDGETEE